MAGLPGFASHGKRSQSSGWFPIVDAPGARFSKDPKLFGRISGDIILFVSL